ncbi:glycerophosphodiester phosphodiesterase [Bacillus sp. FJAT-45037]|uniref:glycerophosphodiester phosphodiesterase n=1 Tax=Bacillus sp. FJAT-45037 TaxID=2011007 RepID=UPI000C250166|nr:glycerophosphodiester phosphodiesterase [Bacillus sp. FJAT-45037]
MSITKIFAHRGSSVNHPENTMAAFEAAYEVGADGIEFDVQLSQDLVPIVIHDATLDRTTSGRGLVSKHCIEELKRLDAGEWFAPNFREERIPTLEEVLIWATDKHVMLNIELKESVHQREQMIKTVIPLIKEYQLESSVILSSFDHVLISKLQRVAPGIETAVIVTAALFEPEHYIKQLGVTGYHFKSNYLLEQEAKKLINQGIQIRPYTVNEENVLEMYKTWGCAGIFTDDPELGVKVRGH